MQEVTVSKAGNVIVSDEMAMKLKAIKDFQVMKVEMENTEKEFKQALLNAMKTAGVYNVKLEGIGTFSYVRPTTRKSFDSKRFKNDRPDLYEQYVKVSEVNDTVKAYYED